MRAGIIYAATRKEVDNIYGLLQQEGLAVGRYHAGFKGKGKKRGPGADSSMTIFG